MAALSIDQRRAILDREIQKYLRQGYRVASQSDTTAQLVKPKRFNWLTFLICLVLALVIVGIILLAIYLFLYFVGGDKAVYLSVDENGKVQRR